MFNRTIKHIAGLAATAGLAAGLGLAAPATAQAAIRPNVTCGSGWYCLYIDGNYSEIDSEGNGAGGTNPVDTTIQSVSNNTGWTVALHGNGITLSIPPHTNKNGFSLYVDYYTVG